MKNKNQDLELLILEHFDDIFMARVLTYSTITESGALVGGPQVGEYELFKKGPKPHTYTPLARQNKYYYTIEHARSDAQVMDDHNIYSLGEIYHFTNAEENPDFPQLSSKVVNQIKDLPQLLNNKKSRAK